MEFPKEYKPPKVENLARSAMVAWGECNPVGNSTANTPCAPSGWAAGAADCQNGTYAGTDRCIQGAIPSG